VLALYIIKLVLVILKAESNRIALRVDIRVIVAPRTIINNEVINLAAFKPSS
jgi:hypothetical protein